MRMPISRDAARPRGDRREADRRQQHRDQADTANQPRAGARGEQRRLRLRRHRLVLDEDDVRLERQQLAPHVPQQRRRAAVRARDDGAVRIGTLDACDVEQRRRLFGDRQDLVIRRDADNLEHRSFGIARSDRLPDRAFARPVAPCEGFVDHGDARRVGPIVAR